MNILAIFLQHLLKIRPTKHKQTKTTQQIWGHLKKVDVSWFPTFSVHFDEYFGDFSSTSAQNPYDTESSKT